MNTIKNHVELKIFIPTILVLAAICVLIVAFPVQAAQLVSNLLHFITYNLDWVYLLAVFSIMVILIWLAFSKHGKIRFGDESRKFKTFSWASMLFCASIGSSILYWGMSAWSTYCISGIIVGFFFYCKRNQMFRMSEACDPVLKNIKGHRVIKLLIDIFVVLGLMAGVATSLGLMFQNFFRMSFYTDPITMSGFPQDWTTFYWAWWIVYVPIVGLFIARISEGRTIKEIVLGTITIGSAGCWIFFAVLGNFALSLQLDGTLDVVSALENHGAPFAIMEVLSTLPYAKVVIFFYVVLAFISLATSFDSVAYMLASITTPKTDKYQEPVRWLRVFWAFAITVLPITLLFLGGLNTLQLSSVVGSVPILLIVVLLIASFIKELKNYNPD